MQGENNVLKNKSNVCKKYFPKNKCMEDIIPPQLMHAIKLNLTILKNNEN